MEFHRIGLVALVVSACTCAVVPSHDSDGSDSDGSDTAGSGGSATTNDASAGAEAEADASSAGPTDTSEGDTGLVFDPCLVLAEDEIDCVDAGCYFYRPDGIGFPDEACSTPEKNYCFGQTDRPLTDLTAIYGWDDELQRTVVLPVVGGCFTLPFLPPGFRECGGANDPPGCACYCNPETCPPVHPSCDLPMPCPPHFGHDPSFPISTCIMQAIADRTPGEYQVEWASGPIQGGFRVFIGKSGTILRQDWRNVCSSNPPPRHYRCEIEDLGYFEACAGQNPPSNCNMNSSVWPMTCVEADPICDP